MVAGPALEGRREEGRSCHPDSEDRRKAVGRGRVEMEEALLEAERSLQASLAEPG